MRIIAYVYTFYARRIEKRGRILIYAIEITKQLLYKFRLKIKKTKLS